MMNEIVRLKYKFNTDSHAKGCVLKAQDTVWVDYAPEFQQISLNHSNTEENIQFRSNVL